MARINLLPWREAARQRRRKELAIAAFLAAAFVLLAGFGLRMQIAAMIASQEARNQYLQSEIQRLDSRIREIRDLEKTKDNLLARMDVIQQLQESRPEIVHLFDELVKTIPEGVFLTSMNQNGNQVVVEGRAQSNARVSAFMRNIEASDWMTNPRLLLIENKDQTGTGLSHFRLRFAQQSKQEDAPEDSQAAPHPSSDGTAPVSAALGPGDLRWT